MNKVKANTIQFTQSYYYFEVRDPKYIDYIFIPRIYVSRVSDKVVKMYVEIFQKYLKNGNSIMKRLLTYNQNVSNQDDYFRSLQNSNFNFGLPNSLVFLEKTVTAIQQIVAKASSTLAAENVSVNAVPYESTAPPNFYVVSSDQTSQKITISVNNPYQGNFTVDSTAKIITNAQGVFQVIVQLNSSAINTNISFSSDINLNGIINWSNYTVTTSPISCPVFTTNLSTPEVVLSISNLTTSGTPSNPFALTDYNATIVNQNAYSATILWNKDPEDLYTSFKYTYQPDGILLTGTIDWSNGTVQYSPCS